MTNTIIPIVYTPTNEDLNALCVSMQSVIENNYENELKFTIITDENFDKKNIDIIKSQCKKYKNITECEFKFINSEKYKYLKHNSKIIYQSSLYLYDAIDIVKYDKFLFLHFHVINNTNLEELYNTDIKNYDYRE